MSRDMTKPTKRLCAQRRLRSAWASAQSDQSLLCAQWVAKDPSFLHTDSEDSDQTGQMLGAQPHCWFVMSRLRSSFYGESKKIIFILSKKINVCFSCEKN